VEDNEQPIELTKDHVINLRDTLQQSPFFREQRPRSAKVLDLFFLKAIASTKKAERYVLLEELEPIYGDGFDENTARTQLGALRNGHLPSFFVTEGRGLPFKVTLEKAKDKPRAWYLEFVRNQPGLGDCVQGFWRAHFERRLTLLVIGDSLFFRDNEGNFVRNMYCNDPGDLILLRKSFGSRTTRMVPTYSYVGAGQVRAGFTLVDLFQNHRARLKYVRASQLSQGLKELDLLVLGNVRTNKVFGAIQDRGNRLRVKERFISNGSRRISDKEQTAGEISYYAVLTRCLNFDEKHIITMIGSNHGQSVEAVATFLSQQNDLTKLYRTFGLTSASQPLPAHFQVLFKVTIKKEPYGTVLRTEIAKSITYGSTTGLVV